MPQDATALQALEDRIEAAVLAMPYEFDSHKFILYLAHKHQRLYVRALAAYASTGRPFQIVHGQLARRLGSQRHLVSKVGQRDSADIFGHRCTSTVWRRTPSLGLDETPELPLEMNA